MIGIISKLNKLIDRKIYRMGDLWRYNTREVVKKENLAEHSYYAAINVINVCKIFNLSEEIENRCIKFMLTHDTGEIFTNDIPHDFKHSNPQIAEIFDEAEVRVLKDNFPILAPIHEEYINNKKENTLESLVCDLADAICVVQYAKREIDLGNNTHEMKVIYDTTILRCENGIKKIEEKLGEI